MAINNVNNGVQNKPQLDNQKLNQQQTQTQTSVQADAQKAQVANAPRTDSVSLTQSAQQLSQVQKRSTDAPVNQEKVDKLKKAIQNGDYKVNPDALAQKISHLESELFGVKS